MSLLKTIIFIGLALLLAHCGGQGSNSESTVKIAKVEDGVPKTEDGRTILSSESEELVIPEGGAKGVAINVQKLENYIANQFDSISEVTRMSFSDDFYAIEFAFFGSVDRFTVLFNVRTISGTLYENIQCEATSTKTDLIIANCENDQVVLTPSSGGTGNQISFSTQIMIELGSIALEKSGVKKYIN